uniref:BHLH domain-containing protein n=1 Tax=Astyanax mexicanus TaxID=7994 RepID=A0A8B9RH47_ASTMX
MEAQLGFPVNQETKCQMFDFEPVLASTDLGYYSACSSLSPTSSVDSSCFSPPVCQFPVVFDQPKEPEWTGQAWENPTPAFPAQNKRTRSKNPGKKRQSASEREKLRMRDLTKALHHLRTFLPPSVAPAGQTLTKIDTLRLTIRYISYLSSQLAPEDPSNAGNVQSHSATAHVQQGGFSDIWSQSAAQEDPECRGQLYQGTVAYTASAQQMETSSNFSAYYRDTQFPPIHFTMRQTHTH